jgi:hypothetical protein
VAAEEQLQPLLVLILLQLLVDLVVEETTATTEPRLLKQARAQLRTMEMQAATVLQITTTQAVAVEAQALLALMEMVMTLLAAQVALVLMPFQVG